MDERQADHHQQEPRLLKPWKTEEEWIAVLAEMAADLRPRDFALFEEYGDWDDAELVAWGRDSEDETTLTFIDSGGGRFQSVDSVKRLFCGPGKLRFVWVPQTPAEQPQASADS